MKRFNLSEWSITHQALVLFIIILLGAAGVYSYLNLGRAEDPNFTIKVMVIGVGWPGATADEVQTQVTDKIEKKLQELPYLDRVETYSQPGGAFLQVILLDTTPPAKVKDLWYQVRKKVGDIKNELPAGITGPNFNDEFGDVYSALYMLTADGLSLAALKDRADQVTEPWGVEIDRVQPHQARHAWCHPTADFRQRRAAERGLVRRFGRYLSRSHQFASDRRVLGRRRHRGGAGARERTDLPAWRYRNRQARL